MDLLLLILVFFIGTIFLVAIGRYDLTVPLGIGFGISIILMTATKFIK
jgi:hypothetical protein